MSRICTKHCIAMLFCIAVIGTQSVNAASSLWQTDYEKAKKQSQAESKPILAMFSASWCPPCNRMKSSTLVDQSVEALLKSHYVPLMLDRDRDGHLFSQFGINSMPTAVIIDPETGKQHHAGGYQGKGQFLSFLNKHKKEISLASATTPKPVIIKFEEKGLLTPYSLVAIVEQGRLIEGDSQYSVKRFGFTANFATAAEKAIFLKTPEKYWPQHDGACPVLLTAKSKAVLGAARWSIAYDDKLFFCHSKENAGKFIDSPALYCSDAIKVSQLEFSTKN